ncbi:reverse transcriptase domain-containing protein [Varibaculum cambriense]|uniref:reverse transcriptase domain-containing protein n=1 Tax=Varibaculum cambriense TaxID=184870 RepID=UPI0039F5AE9E
MIGYKDLVAFELAHLTTFLPDKNIRRNIQALYNEKIEITPAARNYTKLKISIDSSDGPYPRYRDSAGKIIRGVLPQGAPTSGIIANICAGELDKELVSFALYNGLRYSRYCDDLFFSPRPDHEHFDRTFAGLIIRDVNRAVLITWFSVKPRQNQGSATRV